MKVARKSPKEERKRFACHKCDYQATTQGTLTRHKQSVHDGVTHTCGDCKETFTQKSTLHQHQQAIHEGVMQKCDMCSYSSKHRSAVRRHKEDVHGVFTKKTYPEYNMNNKELRIRQLLRQNSL